MGKKIMVVDDSRFVLEEMRFLLNNTGFDIECYCRSGEEALAQYDMMRPDVVTMDIILPGMDGLETTKQIVDTHPEACIVVVSSLAYEDMVEKAKEAGAKDFIFKPFERDQILKALSRACGLA